MRFTKMHGLGNDYVFLDGWDEAVPADPAESARRVSDRHRGVGGDGLIWIGPPNRCGLPISGTMDAVMRMWNADGSESEMCGNGLRCAAKLAHDHGHIGAKAAIGTGAGVLQVQILDGDVREHRVSVHMGQPVLHADGVPVMMECPDPRLARPMDLDEWGLWVPECVGMGNPHAVLFLEDAEQAPVLAVGPLIENHPFFPHRTNVEFVSRLANERGLPVWRQRTWERGSGETQACGTGACATVVAAIRAKRNDGVREAIVRLDGGDLHIQWADDGAQVVMTGPATRVFSGEWG